jgi:hypothetical protein
VSLSRGEALWCSAMGVARRTVRHRPVGVKSYTRRDHPVIYVDARLEFVGIRRTPREFPTQTAACNRSPARPQASRSEPQARKEVVPGTCHGSAPVPVTEALARSERAAGRRTLPHPAARFISEPWFGRLLTARALVSLASRLRLPSGRLRPGRRHLRAPYSRGGAVRDRRSDQRSAVRRGPGPARTRPGAGWVGQPGWSGPPRPPRRRSRARALRSRRPPSRDGASHTHRPNATCLVRLLRRHQVRRGRRPALHLRRDQAQQPQQARPSRGGDADRDLRPGGA